VTVNLDFKVTGLS